MREKVKKHFENALSYEPSLCWERGKIITDSFARTKEHPQVMRRAIALKDILEIMSIRIEAGELVVGNLASKPRGAPLFPEFGLRSIANEVDEISSRPYDKFEVDEKVKEVVNEILPFWQGINHEDRIVSATWLVIPDEAKEAWDEKTFILNEVLYNGVRKASGDGHIIPSYERLLSEGIPGVIAEADVAIKALDYQRDRDAYKKRTFLEAVKISYQGVISYIERYAKLAEDMAAKEKDASLKESLLSVSKACHNLSVGAPENFHEAIQLTCFIHFIVHIESNGHAISLGRIDQYLYPFYKKDVAEGKITPEDALDLIEYFYIKVYELNKIRPWPETRFKGGSPMFMALTVGGQDRAGNDCTNELTYLFLDALAETRLPAPTVLIRVHESTPDKLLIYGADILRQHGGGLPAFFSDETMIAAIMKLGAPLEDAREYAIVGCSEAIVPGKSLPFVGGDCYVNFLKLLEITLNEGANPKTNICVCPARKPEELKNIEDVIEEFKKQLAYHVGLCVPLVAVTSVADLELNPTPFTSGLIDFRIEIGQDVSEGGGPNVPYSVTTMLAHGIGDTANALHVIDKLVFQQKTVDLKKFTEILRNNWSGQEGESLRKMALSLSKYGNDLDEVDKYAVRVADIFATEAEKYTPWRGGKFGLTLQGLTANVPEGEYTGATADGRLAGEPLSDNASPHAGTDVNGPTATLKSVSKIDHTRFVNGNILNLKFHPSVLQKPYGDFDAIRAKKFSDMIKSFLVDLKGSQVQFNVISVDELRKAQSKPDEYKNLVVKVAGYSAFFISLDKALQDQIIERTEHLI